MLESCRVLDLTDERGDAAGFLLGQLGADVVAVEPPGGHASRHRGPYVDDRPGVDRSLRHWAYNRGKRSVVADHPEQLRRLAAAADVVLACGALPPGVEPDLAALRAADPRLVTVSLSPFGGDGPKARWAATDLTIVAASGQLSITGDRDRAPVRISVPQAWVNAASEAACAVLVALHERHRSGRGQHIDVSAQEAMMLTAQGWMSPALTGQPSVRRLAGGAELLGSLQFRFVYACADGHVTITFLPGVMVGPYTNRLLRWVHEEGFCDEELASVDWATLLVDRSVAEAKPIVERTCAAVTGCVARHTKAELFALARSRQFLLVPVATTADVLARDHHASRGFWDEVDVSPLLGGPPAATSRPVRFPGPYAISGDAPLSGPGRPPGLGEHTAEVSAMWDAALSPADPPAEWHPDPPAVASGAGGVGPAAGAATGGGATRRVAPGAPAGEAGGTTERPALDGLKVVDLTWVYAGPFATRMLAYHGATVVRVESTVRPDQVRSAGMARDGAGGPEDSMQWHSINADKLGLQLNLAVPEARDVLVDLARWADVVIEGFAPGVMDRLGLGADVLRAANPQLITVSTSLFGHSGPLSSIPGFGNMGAAMAGFYEVTGWPDRLPAGPYLAYTDATSPRLTALVMLAALEWRRRHGRGAHIDLSQVEGGLHFLTPALLDSEVNGRVARRVGNADPDMAPHGVYPVAAPSAPGAASPAAPSTTTAPPGGTGSDLWIAVACASDDHWRALAGLLGRRDLAELDVATRLTRADELDELVGAWTSSRTAASAQEELQAVGIPAHQVQNSPECVADPQLRHRDHFAEVCHPVYGHSWAEQFGFRLSRTPGRPRRAGPTWGEHNDHVLVDLLGYDDERLVQLAVAGALE